MIPCYKDAYAVFDPSVSVYVQHIEVTVIYMLLLFHFTLNNCTIVALLQFYMAHDLRVP